MMLKLLPILLMVMTFFNGCADLSQSIIKEIRENQDGIKSELEELKDGLEEELKDGLEAELKDGLEKELNGWLKTISKYGITQEKDLEGKRKLGRDDYVGSYQAEYTRFNGKEYLFGGTSMERENGAALKVTYSLKIQSGTAALYWMSSADEHIILGEKEIHMIAEATSDDVYEITLNAGDNYIVVEGDNFTGSLSVKVTDEGEAK